MDELKQDDKVDAKITQEKVDVKTTQETTQLSSKQPEENDQDKNWRKFREARELERKQAEETAKRAAEKEAEVLALKAAMDAILNKPNNSAESSRSNYSNTGFDEEETEDQRIEKKVNALLAHKEAEQEHKRRQQEEREYPEKLKNVYSDFNQVCSSNNLDYLEYHHPELARSLGSRAQGFEKWSDIYNAIKRYVPNTDIRKDKAKAEANLNKPQSLSSTGVTQGGNAMGSARLDQAKKDDNWARMQKSIKGLSS